MSNLPAEAQNNLPALPTDDPFAVFNEAADTGGVVNYRVQYHGDKEKGLKKGFITMAGTEQTDMVNAVLLRIANRGNVKWSDPFDPKEEMPLCYSSADGWRAENGTQMETAETCAECGLSSMDYWREHKKKPPCAALTEVLYFDRDRMRLFVMPYSRKNRDLLFKVQDQYRNKMKDANQEQQITWQFGVTLGMEEDGIAYRPTFVVEDKLDDELLSEIILMHNAFAPNFVAHRPFQPKDDGDEQQPAGEEVKQGKDDDLPFS